MERWIQIRLKIDVSEKMTIEEIRKWIEYHVHLTGHLDGDNPMIDKDLEPLGGWVHTN